MKILGHQLLCILTGYIIDLDILKLKLVNILENQHLYQGGGTRITSIMAKLQFCGILPGLNELNKVSGNSVF
jgi:hypothetical protein